MMRLFVTIVLAACGIISASGTSYYFPKFGRPIVSDSSIVFTEPGWTPHRVISIDRVSGEKNWEISDSKAVLEVWIAPNDDNGNRYVITKGNDVFFCDPADGSTTPAYQAELERCSVSEYRDSLVFVGGAKNDVDWLQLVDLKTGKKIWEVPEVQYVSSSEGGMIICQRSTRKVTKEDGSYQRVNRRLTALSDGDGKILWEHQCPKLYSYASSMHVGSHLLVEDAGTLHCYEQESGELLKSVNVEEDGYRTVSLCRDGERIVAWVRGADVFSEGTVYEISVPKLTKRRLIDTDWYAATSRIVGDVVVGQTVGRMDAYNLKTGEKVWRGRQWNWQGVHEGCMFYSVMSKDGKHADLKRIRVETGERKLLYREVLPKKKK